MMDITFWHDLHNEFTASVDSFFCHSLQEFELEWAKDDSRETLKRWANLFLDEYDVYARTFQVPNSRLVVRHSEFDTLFGLRDHEGTMEVHEVLSAYRFIRLDFLSWVIKHFDQLKGDGHE